MNKLIKSLFVLLLVAGITTACENFLTPSLDQAKTNVQAIQSLDDLQNSVNGAFDDDLSESDEYGRDFPVTLEASSDNAYSNGNSGRFVDQDRLQYTPNSGYAQSIWQDSYQGISDVNLALQQAGKFESSPRLNNIKGQAYALRAFLHMNVLMTYGQQFVDSGTKPGGIPYKTEYGKPTYPGRLAVAATWDSIGVDFAQAVQLMKPTRKQDFDPTHMNYWAARGLQCRYGVYSKQWDLVKTACKDIIDNGPFKLLAPDEYVSAWASGTGPESLLEISFIPTDHHVFDNIAYIYLDTDYGDVVVTDNLYNIYGNGDARLKLYTKNGDVIRMTGKYTSINGNDNTRVMRYAEVILNYAEALARTNQQPQAMTWINKLASIRNETPYTSGSVANVLLERRKELAMEGFRLFDLARNGKSIVRGDKNSLLVKDIPVGDYRFALPIPRHETDANESMKQNKGYK